MTGDDPPVGTGLYVADMPAGVPAGTVSFVLYVGTEPVESQPATLPGSVDWNGTSIAPAIAVDGSGYVTYNNPGVAEALSTAIAGTPAPGSMAALAQGAATASGVAAIPTDPLLQSDARLPATLIASHANFVALETMTPICTVAAAAAGWQTPEAGTAACPFAVTVKNANGAFISPDADSLAVNAFAPTDTDTPSLNANLSALTGSDGYYLGSYSLAAGTPPQTIRLQVLGTTEGGTVGFEGDLLVPMGDLLAGCSDPGTQNVRAGTVYVFAGAAETGTCFVPAASNVLQGVRVDNTVGLLTIGSGSAGQVGAVDPTQLTIVAGDDYATGDANPITFTDPGNWPTLSGEGNTFSLVVWRNNTDQSPQLGVVGTLVSTGPQVLEFQPAAGDTGTMVPGPAAANSFEIGAVISVEIDSVASGLIRTLPLNIAGDLVGSCEVLPGKTGTPDVTPA